MTVRTGSSKLIDMGNRTHNRRGADEERTGFLALGTANLSLLIAAAAAIILGYVLLSRGSITAAPLLLVLGYVVLIPAGLLVGFRRRGE